jgi:parvulin-like peptidyl-prolyl isomerase
MTVTKLKGAAAVLAVVLAAAAVGGASLGALAGGPAGGRPQPQVAPAEARVKRLKAQIADLNRQLREAEAEAAREKAAPPRDKPIAVIFGDVPVTREEVADHLLARMSAKQLDQYLNLRILEHAAREKGVRVSDAEVGAHLKKELRRVGLSEQAFREKVLHKHQKTLREWKEDVVRPRLLLEKLAVATHVTEAGLRAAYKARYGEKVECRALIMGPGDRAAAESVAKRIRSGEVTFSAEAERLRPGGGAVAVTLPRVAPKEGDALVKAAFALKPGEASRPVAYGGGFVILECRRRVPADTSVRFEDVREALRGELAQRLREDAAKDLFKELKARARPRLLWAPPGDGEK